MKSNFTKEDSIIREEIFRIFRKRGITSRKKGTAQMVESVLVWLQWDQPLDIRITKDLYPEVAARCGSKPTRVEYNLRSFIAEFSERSPHEYMQIMGLKEMKIISNKDFIERMAYYYMEYKSREEF